MKEVSLIIVADEFGEWEGIYANGWLFAEGHSISMVDWIDLIKAYRYFSGDVKIYEVASEWLEKEGSLPVIFEEIPKEFLKML